MEFEFEEEEELSIDFLWNRYRTLQHHLERTYAYPGAEQATERRHELYLRELIDTGDFRRADSYVRQMAEFCASIHDSAAAQRYTQYRDRVAQISIAQA